MKLRNVTIGADPELFIINEKTKKVVSAVGLIPGEKGNPWRADDMPEGFGLETDNIHAISLCAKQKNLFGDTAWVPIKNVVKFIEKCGSEKILFGTDNPIDGKDTYSQNKKGEPSIYLDYFKNSEKISSSDYENLMGKNALRVFNL